MKNSMRVAFCGVIAALSTVLFLLTGVVPVATIALPAIAGCLLIPVVVEVGLPWAFGVYGVCCVLGLLFAPDREALLIYLLFFGYYPALFAVVGRIRSRVLRYGVKLLVLNVAVVLEVLLSVYALGIPLETLSILGAVGAGKRGVCGVRPGLGRADCAVLKPGPRPAGKTAARKITPLWGYGRRTVALGT